MATEGGELVGTALILHKTPNVELRINNDSYCKNLLMEYKDSPFPITEDRQDHTIDVIDICSNNEGGVQDAMALFFYPRHTTPSKR